MRSCWQRAARAQITNPASPAIRCRSPRAFVHGDGAFVICYEEIEGAVLIATNLFVREGPGWKMTHHQAGPVAVQNEEEDERAGEDEEQGRAIH